MRDKNDLLWFKVHLEATLPGVDTCLVFLSVYSVEEENKQLNRTQFLSLELRIPQWTQFCFRIVGLIRDKKVLKNKKIRKIK